MSLYNIVGSASLAAGQPEDVSQVVANLQAIQTVLNGGIDDVNIRATAAIALSKLNGYPADGTKFAAGDGTWKIPGVYGIYRKTTPKQVVNSIVETDLLNGEVTIAAGLMGLTGAIRLTAIGDLINNTGAAVATPRLKLKLGATTLIDSNVMAAAWVQSAARWPWRLDVLIQNLGAANSQWTDLRLDGTLNPVAASAVPTTGEGISSVVAASDSWFVKAGNATAVDTTAAQALALTVTLPTANALEDMTLKFADVELI